MQVCEAGLEKQHAKAKGIDEKNKEKETSLNSMMTWCTSYEVPETDDLYNEMKRKKNVIEQGLFNTAWQFNFAPKLFCFSAKEKDASQIDKDGSHIDRVLAYSMPSEVDG